MTETPPPHRQPCSSPLLLTFQRFLCRWIVFHLPSLDFLLNRHARNRLAGDRVFEVEEMPGKVFVEVVQTAREELSVVRNRVDQLNFLAFVSHLICPFFWLQGGARRPGG